jgi:hypothetical protein
MEKEEMSNPIPTNNNESPSSFWVVYDDIATWLKGLHTLASIYQMCPTRLNLRALYRHYAMLQEKLKFFHDTLNTENLRIPSGEEHLPPDEDDDPMIYHKGDHVEIHVKGVLSTLYGDAEALLLVDGAGAEIPILLEQITRKT